MSRQLLIETRTNALSLVKDAEPKVPGCLATISGPCASYTEATRNNHFYSKKLWENARHDELVEEALETKTLIGELDHPGDRLETKATNAAIVMTDFDVSDDGNVYGTFDVLDTPNGRIMKTLLDYGCKLGVSSRGEGDVTETERGEEVDEDSYYFVCFDAVITPAVKIARPSLTEGLKRKSLKESIIEQVSAATTQNELSVIRKVIESAQLPGSDSILESVDNKSKELEGTTDSSNLMEDLESASAEIGRLKNEVTNLRTEVATAKSATESVRAKLRESTKSRIQLSRSNKEVSAKYKDLVFESAALRNDNQNLRENLSQSTKDASKLRKGVASLKESLSKIQSEMKTLQSKYEASQLSVKDHKVRMESLSKELQSIKSESNSQRGKVASLTESFNQTKSSLRESAQRVDSMVKDYVGQRSRELGLNPQTILESVTSKMTLKEIDQVLTEELNRSDRYRALPMIHDNLLSSHTKGVLRESVEMNNEAQRTEDFMSHVINSSR